MVTGPVIKQPRGGEGFTLCDTRSVHSVNLVKQTLMFSLSLWVRHVRADRNREQMAGALSGRAGSHRAARQTLRFGLTTQTRMIPQRICCVSLHSGFLFI